MTIKPWKLIESITVSDSPYLQVRRDICRLPNGAEIDYHIAGFRDYVVVLALTSNRQVVLVRQYRQATGMVMTELPAGVIDEGEEPAATAIRELREETGYLVSELYELGRWFPLSGKSNCKVTTFFAQITEPPGQRALDETEEIETFLVPVEEVEKMINSGEICTTTHIATYFTAKARFPSYF